MLGRMAAGEEAATVFLETSLGTHLVVSFPASATTVQDLKRRVSDEHAASFPRIGHITVQSFKVRRRGSWYHLTDSMAVRAAFHGIKGAWYLQAHVLPHSAAAAHEDAGCGTHNAIGVPLLRAPSQGALSDTASMDQEDGHDHPDPGAASALAPHAAGGTSVDKCNSVQGAVRGENSDPDVAYGDGPDGPARAGVIEEPRGRKHFREEDAAGDLAALVCSTRQDDQNKCTHSSISKRACTARVDELLDGVGANSIVGSGDIIVLSSDDDEMLEGLDFLETKKEEAVSTRTLDQAETLVEESCDHEVMSITNDQGSKLCFSVNENDSTTDTGNHADEGMAQEKLVEQQDHLDNDKESNSENQAPCFSVNKNDSTTAMEEHADGGMSHEKLVEQQDHLDNGAEMLQNCNSKDSSVTHPEYVSDCHQYERSSRSFDSKCCKKSGCEISAVGDLPPCAETLKEGNSSEKEAMAHDVKGKGPWTDRVCNGEKSSKKETYLPPCVEALKKVDYSEKEQVAHKVEEKETARVSNGGGTSNGTDRQPYAGSMKECNSSEEGVTPIEEKKRTRTVTLVDVDGTKWEMELDDSFEIGPQESSSCSDAEESYRRLAKPHQNAEECLEGTPENGGTGAPAERSDLPRHGSFKSLTSNDPMGPKVGEGTSADGAEQGAWDGRRRPRHVVRKMPNSRAAKMYGYR